MKFTMLKSLLFSACGHDKSEEMLTIAPGIGGWVAERKTGRLGFRSLSTRQKLLASGGYESSTCRQNLTIKSVTVFEQLSTVCLPDPPVNRF
jgi:hypothetical protein